MAPTFAIIMNDKKGARSWTVTAAYVQAETLT